MGAKNYNEMIKVKAVTGGAAAAQLTCAGIAVGDYVNDVVNTTDGANIDLTKVTIPAAGKIAIADVNTTGKALLVVYSAKNNG